MTTDEGFREIQLNGKQLVFLFMAATVVSVVIFLCGVLVGRGVRGDHPGAAEETSAAITADPAASPPPQAATPPAGEPPAPSDELSYPERLQRETPPQENLKLVRPAEPPPPVAEPQPSRGVAPPAPAPARQAPVAATPPVAAAASAEPSGLGFAVQVMTFPDRRGADTLVAQLSKKGYPAFVAGPVTSGGRSIYRVRVGKYKDRREAEAVSHRLETEEQFKPWIAR